MSTDIRCFDFTRVYPFSGSAELSLNFDCYSHFYARGKCVDPPPHKLVVVRNFQKLDVKVRCWNFLCVMISGMMFYLDLITFPIVWSVLI